MPVQPALKQVRAELERKLRDAIEKGAVPKGTSLKIVAFPEGDDQHVFFCVDVNGAPIAAIEPAFARPTIGDVFLEKEKTGAACCGA